MWERVEIIGEPPTPTRRGSSSCSINCVPVPCVSCASLPSAGEGIHRQRILGEDLETPHFKHKTDFKHEVFIDESDHHSIKPTLPKIIVLSFILQWVANYGLKKLKMEISRYMGPSCTHQKSVPGLASAKYCSVLPSIEINVSCGFCCCPSLSPTPCLRSATSRAVCWGHSMCVSVPRLLFLLLATKWDCSQQMGNADPAGRKANPWRA